MWRADLAKAVSTGELVAVKSPVVQDRPQHELTIDGVLAFRDLEAYEEMIDLLQRDSLITQSPAGPELTA